MISQEKYYTAPSDEIFEDIKKSAMLVWSEYDDTYGYATEKINSIKDIKNVKDNWAYMVAMFDTDNQTKLLLLVKLTETRELLIELMEQ